MDINQLTKEIRACRKCSGKLAQYGVEPRPIFSGGESFPVLLLGQAPGITEYKTGKPFQGDAGKSIKGLFESCGVKKFDDVVYQTSVTKCFPGRLPKANSDRVPSKSEVANCAPFLIKQLELVRPKILVCLGGLAWRAYVQTRSIDEPGYCHAEFGITSLTSLQVPHLVGRAFDWGDITVIPMIHPAPTANGARAQYPQHDENSKAQLKKALEALQ